MIYIQSLQQNFKLKFNKLNSNHKLDFPTAYIDDIANQAIREFEDIFFHGTNIKKYKIGFEVTQQRLDMLSNLIEKDKYLVPYATNSSNPAYDIVEFKLSNLDAQGFPTYKTHVKSRVETKCGFIPTTIKQHDDIDDLVIGKYTKPSLEWFRVYMIIGGSSDGNQDESSLYIYVPKNSFVTRLQLDYLRKTPKVFSGGYNTLEFTYGDTTAYNVNSPVVHCEIKDEYSHILVDIMVDIASRILEDPQQVQFMQDKLINQY